MDIVVRRSVRPHARSYSDQQKVQAKGSGMSYQIGLDAIHLRPTPRLAHAEYCTNDALKRHMKQMLPSAPCFEDRWEMDFLWLSNDGPGTWAERGRVTDMGHAEYLEGGRDKREAKPCPFHAVEEVWEFDAVKEYGLHDFDELVKFYEDGHQQMQSKRPNQLCPGGYYKTIVSGAIDAFGWEMLLEAASDQQQFEKVLDSFFRLSLHYYKAQAQTSIEAFICHDDMVWTEGPFIHPDFYRRVIFPRYAELWSVLKKAGKKVLYCSDGDWTMFIDDIVKAGADGFIFEPVMSLDAVVEKCGQTHAIIGSKLDCRTLTFGTKEEIQREIDATLPLAMKCPGFFFAVGNHIPSNVPVENATFYFDYLKKHWNR
jgi:hypothetical protein